ncbi:MAG: glutaminyl-peptide cyclotransferase [Chitinophagaceae bacterium]
MKKVNFLFLLTVILASCSNNGKEDVSDGNDSGSAPLINYSVKNVFPHDTASFTEGFLVHDGQLYESTGGQPPMPYKSFLGPVNMQTGIISQKVILDTSYFGEGINIFKNKLYQLTWQNHKGFIYDLKTYKKIGEFTYNTEGWALTNDGTNLIMSDGSSNLQFLDPDSLKVVKIVGVMDNNGPVSNINELEYIRGFIYANKYGTTEILKIDPASGKVVAKIDLRALDSQAKSKYPGALEMNGIAFDSASGKIYVTGKAWPHIYEVSW